ncbi:hypothetical protein V6N13_090917 [Hibiscus sabdariffa]|uniref:Uncharacterized protein n=2 Tax=Hibiscus sabdariffa TaxID=183260 RepID=A0ABR2PBQ1_9ROSI
MELAIEKMNNARIDGKIILVSKARFPAPSKKPVKPSNHVSGGIEEAGAERGGLDAKISSKRTHILNETRGIDSRTFKDVLQGKPKNSQSRKPSEDCRPLVKERDGGKGLFDLYIPVKDIAWIDLSIAGVMKQLFDIEFIQKALLSDGINARVASWGNSPLSCVITFKSVAERDDAWAKREVGLSYWFDHLEPILNSNRVPAAFMFISLIEVPLHCWHESFFVALGNRWGSIKVRSLGRMFNIKISLGKYQKSFVAIEDGGEVGHFADEWPSVNDV